MTLRVLVVDDNEDHRFLIRRALAPLGDRVRVSLAADGPAALAAVAADPPDLVLLDVKMPGMDGFEVLRRLRAEARSRTLPIVLFTSSDHEEERQRGADLGASGFVTKPLDAASFSRVVRATLEAYL